MFSHCLRHDYGVTGRSTYLGDALYFRKQIETTTQMAIWKYWWSQCWSFLLMVKLSCLYLGLSENRVYSQWNSHLIGIMISKTIGFRGTLFSDTPISCQAWQFHVAWWSAWNAPERFKEPRAHQDPPRVTRMVYVGMSSNKKLGLLGTESFLCLGLVLSHWMVNHLGPRFPTSRSILYARLECGLWPYSF